MYVYMYHVILLELIKNNYVDTVTVAVSTQ